VPKDDESTASHLDYHNIIFAQQSCMSRYQAIDSPPPLEIKYQKSARNFTRVALFKPERLSAIKMPFHHILSLFPWVKNPSRKTANSSRFPFYPQIQNQTNMISTVMSLRKEKQNIQRQCRSSFKMCKIRLSSIPIQAL
jgi:hypothetical protein